MTVLRIIIGILAAAALLLFIFKNIQPWWKKAGGILISLILMVLAFFPFIIPSGPSYIAGDAFYHNEFTDVYLSEYPMYNPPPFEPLVAEVGIEEIINPQAVMFGKYMFSSGDILVKYQYEHLYLSQDQGQSYGPGLSIHDLGTITFIHVFENGNLLICDEQQAYYSEDWQTLNESTVLDIDGNPLVPTEKDNFTLIASFDRQIVDGVEIKAWGNYSTEPGVEYDNINVWYTADYGKTVKSTIKFGTSGNGPISELETRHVHGVDFNAEDETFWLQTGDHDDEPIVAKGIYDLEKDTWEWDLIGQGQDYKWSNVIFYEGYAYFNLDYSPDGGVMRAEYEDIGDVSKHKRLLTTPNDAVNMIMGERGDMVVTTTKWGGPDKARMLYYSPDRIHFYDIVGDRPAGFSEDTTYGRVFGANSQGKILAGVWDDTEASPLSDWDGLPSVWLDEMVRNAGFPDAFKPLK